MEKIKSPLAFLNNNQIRAFLFQVIILVLIVSFFYNAVGNLLNNIESRGIHTGFDFLGVESGFDIAEHLIDYSSTSSNLRVFYVGLINTIVVSVVGIIFASIIGLVIGIARLSNNWLIAKLAGGYIELFRNIPILLQILFWYNLVLVSFPSPKQSFELFGSVFVNLRGIYLPKPIVTEGFIWVMVALVLGIALRALVKRHFNRVHDESGVETNTLAYSLLLLLVLPVMVYLILGSPMVFDYPVLKGFNFKGGMSLSPEFLSLAFALSIYTATYIAEAIRSGIESVSKGQKEAALAMGLTPRQSLRLVVLPQALKLAIPPIINQYLNLTKNSSLAAAIGYSELVSVFAGTMLNQVGQALEIIFMTMMVYLAISLMISLILNIVNHKMSIKER
ncbi:amino acid ABC transporter permease [bacterium endosymbiont of Bathymodiolus sp. 5 South]|jgi:general L-amino acid transport system permease protein|uniref:amino acid ABC transporter permease n=1 Tax=bacterium endosymbiont of Bathymodiolus sp. 5 South TaxID=1181670 RepID=UPI0010B2F0DC|nr:ABC transporter permease subunit [bacterium endosymbiont of Bathymodiolus sp. 5 South]CAC9653296.1 L-amino acid ABC transporter (Glu/Asp/His/...), permease protein 1 AapQ [uncultured Gammaproteobacteria bacterium]SHN89853.1 Amino acid ABC transporter, permease protein [bacterium endosymbiont of Bathymodiolus sp. 5 South]SSC08177.1 Glutamate Aspartate transport system permease protein GltJ (TC 3.A.1.3.4) [bacterium endosymbiont of Bathymodiolus sp. 5 South]VVH55672.1 Amino acid ABC transporte